jgi:galactose-1-phosphate uridylyltransferase
MSETPVEVSVTIPDETPDVVPTIVVVEAPEQEPVAEEPSTHVEETLNDHERELAELRADNERMRAELAAAVAEPEPEPEPVVVSEPEPVVEQEPDELPKQEHVLFRRLHIFGRE